MVSRIDSAKFSRKCGIDMCVRHEIALEDKMHTTIRRGLTPPRRVGKNDTVVPKDLVRHEIV